MANTIIETKTGDDKVALIKYAIENKYMIKFYYRGVKVGEEQANPGTHPQYKKKGYRWVQPVSLGISPKPDESGQYTRKMLRGWQNHQGVTNTRKPEWKTFLLDEMSNVIVFDSSDSIWFKPFDTPDGPGLNTQGDRKFLGGADGVGTVIKHIDVTKPHGPDTKQPAVTPEPEMDVQAPVQKKTVEPTQRQYKKGKVAPQKGDAKPKMYKSHPTPKDDEKIEDLIIPTSADQGQQAPGQPADAQAPPEKKQARKMAKPGAKPDQNKTEPLPGEEPLK